TQYKGRIVGVGIRPDHLSAESYTDHSVATLEGKIRLTEMLGADQLVHLDVAADPVLTDEVVEAAANPDGAVLRRERDAEPERVNLVARVSADVRCETNQTMRVAVPPDRLHFFDLQSGKSLRSAPKRTSADLVPAGRDRIVS